MPWLKRQSAQHGLTSEKGLLELTGREANLPQRQILLHFRDLVSADMGWADSRKSKFRSSASRAKVAALILAALSTVILGIDAIPGRSWIALPIVASVTVLSALEPFFNWRSRWVLMEETQYRLNRLRDELDYYLTVTPPDSVSRKDLDHFFAEQQTIWNDVSRRWVEFRGQDTQQSSGRVNMPND